jgi:hypothetical protein
MEHTTCLRAAHFVPEVVIAHVFLKYLVSFQIVYEQKTNTEKAMFLFFLGGGSSQRSIDVIVCLQACGCDIIVRVAGDIDKFEPTFHT